MDEITLTTAEAARLYQAASAEADRRRPRASRREGRWEALRHPAAAISLCVLAAASVVAVGVFIHDNGPTRGGSAVVSPPSRTATQSAHTPWNSGGPSYGLGNPQPWAPRLKSFGGGAGVDAQTVSLADARARAGYPVGVPSSDLAPPSAIRRVWFWRRPDDGGNVVAIEYARLEIVYGPVPASYRAVPTYRNMVKQGADPGARIHAINGIPAYLAPPRTDVHGVSHPGYVVYTKDNVQISVVGDYTATQLLAIADSISR